MLTFNTMRFGTDEFTIDSQPKVYARVNGSTVTFLCRPIKLSSPAIAFRYGGETHYIYLVDPSDELASSVRIYINGKTYALAKDI